MAGHSHLRLPAEEPGDFAQRSLPLSRLAKGAGVVGLLAALGLGFLSRDGFQTFFFGYLTALGYFMAIALGALFFVLIHHVTRAGWSVNVRRVAENMAAMLPVLAALSVPIFFSVLIQRGDLYRWALPSNAVANEVHPPSGSPTASPPTAPPKVSELQKSEDLHELTSTSKTEDEIEDPGPGNRRLDELTLKKLKWLNPAFFCIRMAVYFAIWSVIAMYFFGQSTRQDIDGDYRHTVNMQKYSAPSLVLFGLSVTLAAYDIFMSLDPHWYTTMFGVYYFGGSVQSFFAGIIVILFLMQRAGYLKEAVTVEHYHDLGKYLFAFVFFFGYIGFSQYMLQWYANLPDEVGWPARHGMSTANGRSMLGNSWHWVSLLVLFGCILIPFPALMSRHVKRKTGVLVFWACWLLFFQFINLIWIVLPEMRHPFRWMPILMSAVVAVGMGGVLVAAFVRLTSKHKLRPVNDPRMAESAAFINT
jgi:hypothetical protein